MKPPKLGDKVMAYDSKCYDLAEFFLSEEKDITEEMRQELAQDIQTVIEDYIMFVIPDKRKAKE